MKKIGRQEFDALFNLHYEQMVRTAYALLSDSALAEDKVQEVFIKFWEKRESLNIEKSITTYLKRAVIFHSIDHLRKAKKMEEHITNHSNVSLNLSLNTPETELLNKENLQAIYDKIEALPNKTKLIFKLNRFEHLTYTEIAETLEMSIKSIEYHMSKALNILRKTVFGLLFLSLLEIN